ATITAQRAHRLLLADGYQWQKRENGQSSQMLHRHCPFNWQNTSDPQTRCQAPGDAVPLHGGEYVTRVSISDEMPGPWRLKERGTQLKIIAGFNLRREGRK